MQSYLGNPQSNDVATVMMEQSMEESQELSKLGGQRRQFHDKIGRSPSVTSQKVSDKNIKQWTGYMGQPEGLWTEDSEWSALRGVRDLLLPQMTEGQIYAEKELSGALRFCTLNF